MNGPVKKNKLSKNIINKFTLNGLIPILDFYLEDNIILKKIWDDEYVNKYILNYLPSNIKKFGKIRYRSLCGEEPYGDIRIGGASFLHCIAFESYFNSIKNKRVAVIGSQTPWLEAIIINYGAKEVFTIEYNVPICNHPNLKCISYQDFKNNKL